MSYDVIVGGAVRYGDDWPDITEYRNMTSNLAPMWRAAGIDLAECDGRPAAQVAEGLAGALLTLEEDPERFRAMNPPNGWGDYEGCKRFLAGILEDCRARPAGVVWVNR